MEFRNIGFRLRGLGLGILGPPALQPNLTLALLGSRVEEPVLGRLAEIFNGIDAGMSSS